MKKAIYLDRDGTINRLATFTSNFDEKLIGKLPHYTKLKEYEKYIK